MLFPSLQTSDASRLESSILFCFEALSHYVEQAGLEIMILLPEFSEYGGFHMFVTKAARSVYCYKLYDGEETVFSSSTVQTACV